jgi:hypothetical protein
LGYRGYVGSNPTPAIMPKYNINNNYCEIDYDKGQEVSEQEIIYLGKTTKSSIAIRLTKDKIGNLINIKVTHPGEK